MPWHEAATLSDIPTGKIGKTIINNQKIAIYNVDGTIYATENRCSHQEVELSNGILHNCQIECPWHGAQFDLKTGQVKALPAALPIKTYPTKVENGKIFIEME
ncbi:MAG: non-heme iron oxygenase ferredoxin subunit [bacterium]